MERLIRYGMSFGGGWERWWDFERDWLDFGLIMNLSILSRQLKLALFLFAFCLCIVFLCFLYSFFISFCLLGAFKCHCNHLKWNLGVLFLFLSLRVFKFIGTIKFLLTWRQSDDIIMTSLIVWKSLECKWILEKIITWYLMK